MISCGKPSDSVDEEALANRRRVAILEELGSEHQAVDWPTASPESARQNRVFTVDVQARLVDHGRPVVFAAALADVREHNGTYVAVFEPRLTVIPSPQVYFRLTVPPEQIAALLAAPRRRYLDELAVVARINSVSRPAFSVRGQQGQDDAGSVYLDLETADVFVAEGTLLDFKAF